MTPQELMLMFRGQNPNSFRPMDGESEGTFSPEDAAMMQDAGWFGGQQAQAPNRLGQMVKNDRVSVVPSTYAQDSNALQQLFQGAIMGNDLDKATRLANTPEQRALLDIAYQQRIEDQDRRARMDAGRPYDAPRNRIAEFGSMQNAANARKLMEQDRLMKVAEFQSRDRLNRAHASQYEGANELARAKAKSESMKPAQANKQFSPEEQKRREAFLTEIAKQDAKEIDDIRNSATKAQSGIQRIQEMRSLVKDGVYSGTLAEARTEIANFFDTMGLPFDKKKLANSQEYLKHAKELTLSLLKEGVGTNQISNADLKFVNMTVPQLETNPKARDDLLNFMEAKLQGTVERFKRADAYSRENAGLQGFSYGQVEDMPTDKSKLVANRKYRTPRGEATWNGTAFVQ